MIFLSLKWRKIIYGYYNFNSSDFNKFNSIIIIQKKEKYKKYGKVCLLKGYLQYFQSYCQYVRSGQYDHIRKLYCRFLYLLGQEHVFTDRNGNFAGTVQGVEPNGHLIIQDTYGKERRYAFKEVRIATDSK